MTPTLTLAGLITLAAVGTLVACLAMAVTVIGVKCERALRERAVERRLAPLRPVVILVAAGEDTEDGEALQRLVAVTGRSRRDLHDLVVQVIGKVRGRTGRPARRAAPRARAARGCRAPGPQPTHLPTGAGTAPHRLLP